jgi:hypothetical protein
MKKRYLIHFKRCKRATLINRNVHTDDICNLVGLLARHGYIIYSCLQIEED